MNKLNDTCIIKVKNNNWKVHTLYMSHKIYKKLDVQNLLTSEINVSIPYENADGQIDGPGFIPQVTVNKIKKA